MIIKEGQMIVLDKSKIIYEDELPKELTAQEYCIWYNESWVDGVRLGFGIIKTGEKK